MVRSLAQAHPALTRRCFTADPTLLLVDDQKRAGGLLSQVSKPLNVFLCTSRCEKEAEQPGARGGGQPHLQGRQVPSAPGTALGPAFHL